MSEIKKPAIERKKKGGLEFPTGRIARYMKNGKFAQRISSDSPIFMTAVLEYMVAEIMELAGKACVLPNAHLAANTPARPYVPDDLNPRRLL